MREVSTDVLVVGSGPTGLMLAAWLAKLGVDAILVDGKDGPTRESRALGVHSRSMEIYDQLGVVDRVLAEGYSAVKIRPGYESRSFGAVPIGRFGAGLMPYPGLHILEQSRNESILLDRLQELGGTVEWQHALVNLTPDAGGVTAECSGPAGLLSVRERFCVGADGGSSAVRKIAGIPFEGLTNEHTFYVADVSGVSGVAGDSVNLRFGAEEFLLGFPMGPGGHHRLLGVLRTAGGEDVPESLARQRLDTVFGITYRESLWFSTYRIHHRVAARFREGPVFLAGDAGHVHSPVGAQGMNTGLQDAHNLAFKLAEVIQGRASESLLDRYEAERRPVALRLVNSTDRVFGLVTSDRRLARTVRRIAPRLLAPAAIRLLPRLPIAPRLFGYLSQIRIHYWMDGFSPDGTSSDKPTNDAAGSAPDPGSKPRAHRTRRGRVIGRRLPWTGPNFEVLRSATWQVHTYGEVDAEVAAAVGHGLKVPVHSFPAAGGKGLQEGLCYLVRPDGFVAGAAPMHTAVSRLRAHLPDQWFGAGPTSDLG
ncbi:FAD-dependent monooxygenase [Arthrobacter tumbae]|uniref:FAD-dependent monooxygenase n=1 Tax=Arthrobacter tumbae TaxID=163874 RepID=UPI001959B26F|nr:FAD-dependent monooxygenase [Arthrobacter tumbae]MBM7780325.1 2-polyprenyl-6-methoxyphenol hydroxylase-like FAD-dependent oxidoreductase [Arthrobacter tumbae]